MTAASGHAPAVRRSRAALGWLARAAVDGAAAGAAVGLVEAIRLAMLGGADGLPALLVVAAGLCALAGVALGVPLCLAARLVGRQRWARRLGDDLGAPGERRVAALVAVIAGVVATAAFATIVALLSTWSHGRFRAAGAVGLLHAGVLTAAGLVLLVAVAGAAPALGRWLGPRAWIQRATRGRLVASLAAVAAAALVVGGWLALRRAAPEADFRQLGQVTALAALLGLLRWLRPLHGRALVPAGAVAGALCLGALLALPRSDLARGRVAGGGVTSARVLGALWAATDRDRDGYAGWFGGSDCDDGDPAVHPGAAEVPRNGIDDNCAGGDLTPDMLRFRSEAVPSARRPNRHNVILVTLDAVRADHTSAYGFPRPTTPNLDALARRGTRFDWAASSSPTTRRAIPSILTSRYASTLAFDESEKVWPPRLKKGHPLLGESFKAAGYHTQAILCCTTMFNRTAGIVNGIDVIDASADRIKKHSANHMADLAVSFLAERQAAGEPFFLWLHFIDPHNPYDQPADAPDFGREEIDRYDAEIWLVDRALGRILAALEQNRLRDTTVVAVTADHGDEFLEHGDRFHGRSLYSELIRVPLVIAAPGGPAHTVAEPVSLVDVGPTVLDLVGLPRPAGQNGRSLAASVLERKPPPDRMVLAELIADRNIKRNLVAGLVPGWQIIKDLDANTYELYSLASDPGMQSNRIGSEPEVAGRLRAALASQIDVELTPLEPRGRKKKPKAAAK